MPGIGNGPLSKSGARKCLWVQVPPPPHKAVRVHTQVCRALLFYGGMRLERSSRGAPRDFLYYKENQVPPPPHWAHSSLVERFIDIEEAAGSIPAGPTGPSKQTALLACRNRRL